MEILTKENLVGAKDHSHCSFQDFHSLRQENQVSLVRIHFAHPEADGKSSDIGVGGRIRVLKAAQKSQLKLQRFNKEGESDINLSNLGELCHI